MTRVSLAAIATAFVMAVTAVAQEFSLPKGPCGSKPPAKDQSRNAGEGLPPLPLPGTPLRRSERKRMPSPPPLIAKIQYGVLQNADHGGTAVEYYSWNQDPGDIPVLLQEVNTALNVKYTQKKGPLEAFPADAAKYPIFYYTGSNDFKLTDAEVKHLRAFVQSGGTIWGDTCFGDPDFFKAFLREMNRVLPDRHFRRLAPEHPLFQSYYDIRQVEYGQKFEGDAPNNEPWFFGLDLGCRTAIILSRYDLSCGWDGHIRDGAFFVAPNDARRMGVNMVAYALGLYNLGLYQSTAKVFYEKEDRARGDFIFAQAQIGENWDSQQNAIANLLKAVATKTSAEVKFVHRTVELGKGDLQTYPFLYMTGHYDFKLSDDEVNALKRYIQAGGFLLASPCCGSREFDVAFRRELARVMPGNTLEKLPAEHAVYHILNDIESVKYTEYVTVSGTVAPPLPLEGITIGGNTPVVYCPFGLGGGWRGFDHPYALDMVQQDATNLGVNIVLYSMTH